MRKRISALALSLLLVELSVPASFAAQSAQPVASNSEANNSSAANPVPSGTMLVPLIPKIDTSTPTAEPVKSPKPAAAASDTTGGAEPESADSQAQESQPNVEADNLTPGQKLAPAPLTLSPELGKEDEDTSDTKVNENTTLKGTVQIVADDTEYDQDTNTFLGTGNAVVIIGGEDSKLEADTILYDQNSNIIDARGNVSMTRQGQVSKGSAFRFNVGSNEYLITNPNTEIQGSTVIARQSLGRGDSMVFRNGTIQQPVPMFFQRNSQFGPQSTVEYIINMAQHPDAYNPIHPSYKFRARKITYDRFKEDGNMTIFGGRVMVGNFGIPVPKFTTTVGSDKSRVTFPVTFEVGNNMQMGGTSFGPSFNYAVGKHGAFEVSPMIQVGSSTSSTSGVDQSGKIGAGGRISYQDDRITSHFAYGSVSNLVVADFKYQISPKTKFQSGINRYLDDGIFGMTRARYNAEVVDYRGINKIPYIAFLMFRTSAGAAEDNPSLLNLTPTYKKLFNITSTGTPSAMRFQEQISASTQPLFSVGDTNMGAKMSIFSGLGLRGYSTGDTMAMAQIGPILDVHLQKLRLETGYFQSGVKGQSPFVFDEFIQGSRSTFVSGDVKITDWLTLGGSLGYNLTAQLLTGRTVSAAIGPPDAKFVLLYDTIRGMNRYGFDLLFGQPVPYSKLVMKNSADAGQLGSGNGGI